MHSPMIDREDVVARFQALLNPKATLRVLRLSGEAKMGKTHLLAKVFPELAQQHSVRCAVLDLRNTQQTIIDHLHSACAQLGHDNFPEFDQNYTARTTNSRIEVSGLSAWFSSIKINARGYGIEDDNARLIRDLTRWFINDVRRINKQIVLIFDQVDDAAPETKTWLMGTFLGQAQGLAHVRIVVGGRAVPEVLGNYARFCDNCELTPVQEERAYIAYCQEVGACIEEQAIRALAKVLGYTPGPFAEAIQTHFMSGD